jgi:hypothetical protein
MADNPTNRPRWSIAPYFIVDDVVATVEGSWPKYSASMGPRDNPPSPFVWENQARLPPGQARHALAWHGGRANAGT